MIARPFLLALAPAALLAASPAAAQSEYEQLKEASLASVLAICVPAMDGQVDFNDTAALKQYGILPADAETEAKLRETVPGIEYAGLKLPGGSVRVGYVAGKFCMVQIGGASRIAIRDVLVKQLTDTNVRTSRTTSAQGDDVLLFHFSTHLITVTTPTTGSVSVKVRKP